MTYFAVKADLDKDADAILSLWARNYGADLKSRFSWLYQNTVTTPQLTILLKSNDEIVGATAFIPRIIKIEGDNILAGQAIDLVVDKNHRTGGPAIKLQRALLAELHEMGVNVLYGVPLPAAQLVTRRVGFKELSTFNRWVKPLSASDILAESKYPALRHFGIFIDIIMRMRSKEIFNTLPPCIYDQTITSFDSSFDGLWENAEKPYKIIGERNSAYLNWRFTNCPLKEYKIFVIKNKKNETLLGYVVFHVLHNRAHVADVLALDIEMQIVLLYAYIHEMRKMGMGSITFTQIGTSQALAAMLSSMGFYNRQESNKMLLYLNPAIEDKQKYLETENWYFTETDIDV